MASNYTLESAVEKLTDRAASLWAEIESNSPDLDFVIGELNYISARASQLAETASVMNEALEKIS